MSALGQRPRWWQLVRRWDALCAYAEGGWRALRRTLGLEQAPWRGRTWAARLRVHPEMDGLEKRLLMSVSAVDDHYTVAHNQALLQAAPGVLANDTHTGSGLTVSAVYDGSNVAHTVGAGGTTVPTGLGGSVTLYPDGHFKYSAPPASIGLDSFQYTAAEGTFTSNAHALITVTDNAPVGVSDAYKVPTGQAFTGSLSGTGSVYGLLYNDQDVDHDPLTVTAVYDSSNVSHGVTATGEMITTSKGQATVYPDGHFTYTPSAGMTGQDTFRYDLWDGMLANSSPSPTVTLNLGGLDGQVVSDTTNATTIPAGNTNVSLQTGNATTTVPLLDCGCSSTSPSVVNQTDKTNPEPIVDVTFQSDATQSVPSGITMTLVFNGTTTTMTYSTAGHSAGDTYVLAQQVSTPITTSGAYNYSVTLQVTYSGGTATGTTSGTVAVPVDSVAANGIGAGWNLGYDSLLPISTGVLFLKADGTDEFFTLSGSTFTSPPGDYGTLVLASGIYTYTGTDGSQEVFTSGGLLSKEIDPHGLTTTFLYSGNLLTQIQQPTGTIDTLTYSSGALQTVQENGATATFARDSNNQITTITFPDGSTRTFGYDSSEHLTSDASGGTTYTYAYTDGMLSSVDNGSGALQTVTPSLLSSLGATAVSANLGSVTDGLGQTTSFTLNSNGQAITTQTPDGASTQQSYNPAGQVATSTDALGQTTSYSYSSAGDLTAVQTPDGQITSYGYDPTFHKVTRIEDPLNDVQTFAYNGTGDLTTWTDATGAVTTYGWSNGLMTSMIDPLGRTTTYAFDGARNETGLEAPTGLWTTFGYDARNRQTSVKDPTGNVTTTLYDGLGRAIETDQPTGEVTTTVYDGAGRVIKTIDAYGNPTTNLYDAEGRLKETDAPLGLVTKYQYNAASQLTALVDSYGNTTTYDLDKAGRITATHDVLGNVTKTAYNAAGEVTATVDAYGHTTTYDLDVMGRVTDTVDVLGNKTTSVYDAAGRLVSSQDEYGTTTSYGYDAANRQTSVQTPFGTTKTAYNSAGDVTATIDQYGHTTSYAFDSGDRLTTTQDIYGHKTTSVYNTIGQLTETINELNEPTYYFYDAKNRVTATRDVNSQVTTSVFDGHDQVTNVIDVYGHTTTYAFDAYGRQTGVQDPFTHWTTTLYDAHSNPTATTDIFSNTTTTLYDSFGRPTTDIDALGNATTTAYDGFGQVSTVTAPLNRTTTYKYDGYGRLTETDDPTGTPTTTTYDGYGNVSLVSTPLATTTSKYDGYGRLTETDDGLSNATTLAYDSFSRVTTVTAPLNRVTTTAYDSYGRATTSTDPLGQVTTTVYDGYGRVTAVTDPMNNTTTTLYDFMGRPGGTIDARGNETTMYYDSYGRYTGGTNAVGQYTSFVYDAYGRVVATGVQVWGLGGGTEFTTYTLDDAGRQIAPEDPDGNITSFNLDALGRTTVQVDPLGHKTTSVYDAAGRVTAVTDQDNRLITYSYDADDRETGETWFAAGSTTVILDRRTFTYDAVGDVLTAANSAGVYTLAYDAMSRVTTVQEPFNLNLTMAYDAAGERTSLQDSRGGITTYVYDADGQLTSEQQTVTGASGTSQLLADLSYDKDGRLTGLSRYSDLTRTNLVAKATYAYDGVGNMTQLQDEGGALTITYTYDNINDLVTQKLNGVMTTYGYDSFGDLVSDSSHTYTYDAAGNRDSGSNTVAQGNRLTTDGVYTYTYDNVGNETGKSKTGDTWAYSYDNQNEMIQAVETTSGATTTIVYKYDAWGNRVETDVTTGSGTTTTRFGYDGWDPALQGTTGNTRFNVWADLDSSNSIRTRYLRGDKPDQLLARAQVTYTPITTETQQWYLTDRLGSVLVVVDSTGAGLDTITYDGWGNFTDTSPANRGRYAWTGREFDVETGLQYNRARYYDPTTSRWMTQDPMGLEAGDSNLYRYVKNKTLEATDPSGLRLYAYSTQTAEDIAGWLANDPKNYFVKRGSKGPGIATKLVQFPSGKVEILPLKGESVAGALATPPWNRPSFDSTLISALQDIHRAQFVYWEKNPKSGPFDGYSFLTQQVDDSVTWRGFWNVEAYGLVYMYATGNFSFTGTSRFKGTFYLDEGSLQLERNPVTGCTPAGTLGGGYFQWSFSVSNAAYDYAPRWPVNDGDRANVATVGGGAVAGLPFGLAYAVSSIGYSSPFRARGLNQEGGASAFVLGIVVPLQAYDTTQDTNDPSGYFDR